MLGDPTQASETVEITDGSVSVSKTVEEKPKGIVVSYMIFSENSTQIGVRLRDHVPASVDIEESGFHPEYEPNNWDVEADELIFETVIPPGRGADIIYGIVTSGPPEIDQYLSPPTLVSAQPMDPSDAPRSPSNKGSTEPDAPLFRSGALSTGEDTEDQREWQSIADSASSADDATSLDEGIAGDEDQSTASSSMAGEESEAEADEIKYPVNDTSEDGPDTELTATNEASTTADASGPIPPEEASSAAHDGNGPDLQAPTASPAEDGTDDSSTTSTPPFMSSERLTDDGGVEASADESRAPDDGRATPAPDRESSVDSDEQPDTSNTDSQAHSTSETRVVESLLAELQTTDATDEQIEQLRDQLGLDTTRALQFRLEHLESRVASVTPFGEHVEGVIDEHGDLAETLTDLNQQLDALRTEQVDNRALLEHGADERDELGTRVETVSERVDGVERGLDDVIERVEQDVTDRLETFEREWTAEVESLEQQLTATETELRDKIESVDHALEHRIAEVNDELDGMADELEALDAALETVSTDVTEQTNAVETRVERLAEQLDSLQQSVDGDLETLRDDVTELADMRTALSEALLRTTSDVATPDDDGDPSE